MNEASSFDFFLSHRAKTEAVMRPRAERLRADGLRRSRVLVLWMSANAFGSDLGAVADLLSTLKPQPNAASLNKERGFFALRLDSAPIEGSNSRI